VYKRNGTFCAHNITVVKQFMTCILLNTQTLSQTRLHVHLPSERVREIEREGGKS
jgi:hypothetical protein